MRADLPSRELQDLRPALGDGKVPIGWARSINHACTAWLLKRGLLGSPDQNRLSTPPKTLPEDEEERAIAPVNVKINGFSFWFRRRRIESATTASTPAVARTEAEASDQEQVVLREDGAR